MDEPINLVLFSGTDDRLRLRRCWPQVLRRSASR
jgi:hypothetical protein